MIVVDTIHEKGGGQVAAGGIASKVYSKLFTSPNFDEKNIIQLIEQEDASGEINWRNTLATSLSVARDFCSIRREVALFLKPAYYLDM